MGVYKNNNGTLTPIANETQFIAPVNEYVTKPELEAIVPSDTSADNKLVNGDELDDKLNDVWKAQGELGAKNLLVYPYIKSSGGYNGFFFTVNDDGSINCNGNASAYSHMPLKYNEAQSIDTLMLPTGKYIISIKGDGEITQAEESSYGSIGFLWRVVWNNGQYPARDYPVYWTPTNNYSERIVEITKELHDAMLDGRAVIQTRIFAGTGTITDNVTAYLMIRTADDTDTTWQPYAHTNYELMQNDNALLDKIADTGRLLWTGSFSAGSIEVVNATKYRVMVMEINTTFYAIGSKTNGYGMFSVWQDGGITANAGGYKLAATANGDNVIFTIDNINFGGWYNGQARPITKIYGLF